MHLFDGTVVRLQGTSDKSKESLRIYLNRFGNKQGVSKRALQI
jgi:hypothetical protein